MALLGKNLIPSDLAIRDRLENKFQLPALQRRFIEGNERVHGLFYLETHNQTPSGCVKFAPREEYILRTGVFLTLNAALPIAQPIWA